MSGLIRGNVKREDIVKERDICECGGIFVKTAPNDTSSNKLFEIDQICVNCGTTSSSKR